jgi:hypothetical protein
MAYTTIDKPTDYFNTVLYTGNDTDDHAITGVNFQPDFVWIKSRSVANNHNLYDVIRGVNKPLKSNRNASEFTRTDALKSFDSDGFTLDDDATSDEVNNNGVTYASWNWLAGGTASSNSNGSITSSVSASTTAGFSVVSWTGNSGTVGHGLGVKPAMIIVKSRQTANNWVVIHKGLTGGMDTNVLILNGTDAESSGGSGMAEPTSSVFTITSGLASNDNNIGYVFAEKKGYSKIGSYTGNGSNDGTFVYTGFKPAFCIVKRTDGSADWNMYDNKRIGYNPLNYFVYPNLSNAEDTSNPQWFDLLSNGFQLRNTSTMANTSGGSYIYMAFAESPFVNSNGVPNNAR